MRDTTFIYGLAAGDTKEIRYFGKSDNPVARLKEHIRDAKRGEKWPVSCWIRKRLKASQNITVHTLCKVPQNDFARFERAFITLGRQYHFRLLNVADGGDGITSGFKHSLEHCAKMSARLKGVGKGRKLSSAHCAAISACQTGKKLSLETRAKLSKAFTGRKLSAEAKAKLSAFKTGTKHSPETLEKMSAWQRGLKRDGKSKFIGVFFDKARKVRPWRIVVPGEKKNRGFTSEEDAVFARALYIANYGR